MAKSCPCWSILTINCDEFNVVLNGCLIFSVGCTVFSQFVDPININEVISLSSSESWFDLGRNTWKIGSSISGLIKYFISILNLIIVHFILLGKILLLLNLWITLVLILHLLWLELDCLTHSILLLIIMFISLVVLFLLKIIIDLILSLLLLGTYLIQFWEQELVI
jgi:hypothetical protein